MEDFNIDFGRVTEMLKYLPKVFYSFDTYTGFVHIFKR